MDAGGDDLASALTSLFALRDVVVGLAADGSPSRAAIDSVVDAAVIALVAARMEALRELALTDELTGLGNRRALERDLHVELARAERTGRPLTVVIIDVDGLKGINDRAGHRAGDDSLRSVAVALQELVRESDRAYRHGGDEFTLLLNDSVADPDVLAERLGRSGAPACSIGIACSATDPPEALLAIADWRMYERRHLERSHRAPGEPPAPDRSQLAQDLFDDVDAAKRLQDLVDRLDVLLAPDGAPKPLHLSSLDGHRSGVAR